MLINKSRPLHTATVDNPKNPRFLAINHGPISYEKDTYKGGKKIPTRITLLRPLAAGWAGAPYKQGQKGIRTSKLSELVGGNAVRFYSYEKVSNNNEKGPRCDDITFELRAGDTLNFWIDDKRLEEVKRGLPDGLTRIEAFTVCEVLISPRNSTAVEKGNGCKIASVKPCSFTLYSCLSDVEAFPETFVDARTLALKNQQAQPPIANDLMTNESVFHMRCASKAYIHDDDSQETTMITLVNSGIEPIDIPVQTLLQYTNCSRKDQACALLEMAIACQALQLLVFSNDFWKSATTSQLRAVPIINTELLLLAVDPTQVGQKTVFPTDSTIVVDDVTYNIQIHIDQVGIVLHTLRCDLTSAQQEPISVANGPPPASPDFVLSSTLAELESAHKIRFALRAADGDEIARYFVGFLDTSPRKSIAAVGFRKRKFVPTADEDDE